MRRFIWYGIQSADSVSTDPILKSLLGSLLFEAVNAIKTKLLFFVYVNVVLGVPVSG